jgi:hypothetical protein
MHEVLLQAVRYPMSRARRTALAAAVALSVGSAPARTDPPAAHMSAPDEPAEATNEIVVTGYGDIVVDGRARRCRPARGDPLDRVRIPGWHDYMMIVPDDRGGFVARSANEEITGPEFWQRVGVHLGGYRFRAPSADEPMCIGGRGAGPRAFGGFRRVVDAAPYRGHRVRFTAWVATGDADQVNFWLASGPDLEGGRILNGGNTNDVRLTGDHDWTPVLFETGPIDEHARHISYGFNLQGSGEVWVYQASLEVVADPLDRVRTDDRVVIGSDEG